MKTEYIKPEIEATEVDDTTMNNTSNTGKPGHGWGVGGHYGPPGHNKQSDEYGYEQELWD